MISTIKTAAKFFYGQGIHSFNQFPPLSSLVRRNKHLKEMFFFTMDDIWEDTNIADLKKLISLLQKYRVKGTFFITPYYNYKELSAEKAGQLKEIFESHEIAMHGIRHKRDLICLSSKERIYELKYCKNFLEKRFGVKISGYRSPSFLRNSHLLKELASSGFLYNSDQFLFRPHPFVKDKMAVIPTHDKCDPFPMGLDEKGILDLVGSKLKYCIKNRKPYVFLMHAYDINRKNLAVLDKIFSETASKGFVVNLSVSDFAKYFFKGER